MFDHWADQISQICRASWAWPIWRWPQFSRPDLSANALCLFFGSLSQTTMIRVCVCPCAPMCSFPPRPAPVCSTSTTTHQLRAHTHTFKHTRPHHFDSRGFVVLSHSHCVCFFCCAHFVSKLVSSNIVLFLHVRWSQPSVLMHKLICFNRTGFPWLLPQFVMLKSCA